MGISFYKMLEINEKVPKSTTTDKAFTLYILIVDCTHRIKSLTSDAYVAIINNQLR